MNRPPVAAFTMRLNFLLVDDSSFSQKFNLAFTIHFGTHLLWTADDCSMWTNQIGWHNNKPVYFCTEPKTNYTSHFCQWLDKIWFSVSNTVQEYANILKLFLYDYVYKYILILIHKNVICIKNLKLWGHQTLQ